jgi:hypothetical protein
MQKRTGPSRRVVRVPLYFGVPVMLLPLFAAQAADLNKKTKAAPAVSLTPVASLLTAGQQTLNWLFRYRLETVDQDGLPEDAFASTLLSRLTVLQGITDQLSAGVEFDYVAQLGDSSFNNSLNGKTQYPLIADPAGSDLNQAYVLYQQPGYQLKVGRQKLALGNERFVGSVGWRQNEQTFDAIRYQTKLGNQLKLDYSFSNRVNRVFGSKSPQGDWRSNIHLFDLSYALTQNQQVSVYAYEMDFTEAPLQSNRTLGMDFKQQGQLGRYTYLWAAALASQQDIADHPTSYRASYQNIEGQLSYQSFQFGAGYERLGSDNGVGFTTPLATLHKFQGFADKFLTTPGNGVTDLQIKAGYVQQSWDVQVQYHWLDAAKGGMDYGNELNIAMQFKLNPQFGVLLKAAHYDAKHYLTDTSKYWLQLLAKF